MQVDEISNDYDQHVWQQDRTPTAGANRETIEQMYRDHIDALVRFLRVRLRSTEEAAEVAQEAFVQLLKMGDLSTVNQPQAYLFRTAANIAINRRKLGGARKRLDELALVDAPQDDLRTPQHTLDMQQQLRRVSEALDRLPADCRAAFTLVRFHEMSAEEAAVELGIHPRTVRRLVQRAFLSCKRAVG